jgi:NAD(P)-dependent dehydrogenase (short-subunit alcohol dehydrogenase family)
MFENIFRLDGKIAVVTGAGNGLGRSFALGLAAFGATVICADKNLAGADETASLVKQSRGNAEPLQVDVGDEASVDDMGQKIAADYRRIDIVVNNAGIASNTPRTHEYNVADWDRVMAVNLRGVFLTTRKALTLMLPGPGSIINLSTALGAERRAAAGPEGSKQFEEAIHARIPMKHRGVPDDLIGLVVYLASDASHYVTGQVIAHDGGWDAMVV